MNCFQFTNGDERKDGYEDCVVSRATGAKVSWARSFSVASSSRRSEARDFNDSIGPYEFLTKSRPVNDLRVFTFAELKTATKGFSRGMMIGEGGFGCVYRGRVKVSDDHDDGNYADSKMDVAVKQLNRNGFQGHKEWINEVNFLGVVKHPNLVKLVGYSAEDDERGIQRLLVYELMCNKSLEDHLFVREASPLSWMARLSVAQDAARGLAYLHEEMDFQIIFRDLKTSNILLDGNFNAKLSDFGLARQGPAAGLSHILTSVVGTVGYAAPEYIQTGKLTAKSDVWSFGVVLYELITGRRAVDRNLPRNEQNLLDWVKFYAPDSKKFHLIVDPTLEGQYCIKSAQKVASLANKCLFKHPKSRPKMSEVVEILGNIITETSLGNDSSLQHVKESQDDKEESEEEAESCKRESNMMAFDFIQKVSFRNKTVRKLDWRNWKLG